MILSFYRDATGKFPEFPDEDDGGSAAIFKEKDPDELEKELREKVSTWFDAWIRWVIRSNWWS